MLGRNFNVRRIDWGADDSLQEFLWHTVEARTRASYRELRLINATLAVPLEEMGTNIHNDETHA